ncbi:MAG: biotin transporter BioY [Clostridia bacterium]
MNKSSKTFRMTMIALFAAVLSVLSQIAIPMPSGVPVTLQTMAVALCAYMLGVKGGVLCIAVYLALGAVGLPVFANLGAGLGKLVGVTGGFLFGFLPMAALCARGFRMKNKVLGALLSAAGLGVCHLLGIIQFALLTHAALLQAFLTVSAPYLIKDALSIAAAGLFAHAIQRRTAGEEEARGTRRREV